ncbi:helicase associated domain-containing protein [Arthrobacter koreensis]|uniref:helicase associated domain-containing protein n=1 Tax=Arthrobacter koreensis TaxID=199136 RepID=UPI00381D3D00
MLHDHPQVPRWGLKNRKPTWQERVDELAAFRRVHGRFPRGYVEDERKLYSFLQHQRKRYRAGELAACKVSFLNEHLPGWLTPPKQDRETKLWAQRAAELESFVRNHGRYPSYKSGKDTAEKVLATWLTRQRRCHRQGTLSEARRVWLDELIPGWHVTGIRYDVSDVGPTNARLR